MKIGESILTPNTGSLGRWLHSWVQPSGAIHGFHNHSVWGDNPYRYGDFTAGHSTFASPLMLGLAAALSRRPDERGQKLLEQLLRFQVDSFQADGQFAHIGFQVGETLKAGLIHNVVPDVAMAGTVRLLGDRLPDDLRQTIDQAIRRNLAAFTFEAGPSSCANQEYCRQWAKLSHMEAFQHREWDEAVKRDLDYLITHFRVPGLPDAESAGVLRSLGDANLIEPAEYYGLMIHPLALAARRYGEPRYLAAALTLARHVARSSWVDRHEQTRFDRLWQRLEGQWVKINEPMLIGGMGLTLAAIATLTQARPDVELTDFLERTDRTYAHYQSPAGFFLAASGWGSEQDIIPSSAWQSHDFYHLVTRQGINEDFWDALFTPDPRIAVVFGPSLLWLESPTHWAVRGYQTMHGLELVGRKDRVRFGVDMAAWIRSGREMPADYIMSDQPRFVRTDTEIRHVGGRTDLAVLTTEVPLRITWSKI